MNRKRVCLSLVRVALTALAPRARAEMTCGVKGGIGFSQMNADLFDTDSRNGFVGGVYGSLDLTPSLAVQPEVLYVRKGAKLFSTNVSLGGITFGRIGTTLDVDYVEVPVLLRLSAPPTGPVDLRLLGGPVASIKVREQLSTTGLIGVKLGTDQIKTTDFGLAVGGAAAMRNGTLKFVAEGRYTFGLLNVSDLPFGGDVKNSAFYGTLGLEFPFGP